MHWIHKILAALSLTVAYFAADPEMLKLIAEFAKENPFRAKGMAFLWIFLTLFTKGGAAAPQWMQSWRKEAATAPGAGVLPFPENGQSERPRLDGFEPTPVTIPERPALK